MEFTLAPELAALQAEAHALADEWTVGLDVLEDAWIVGESRELSLELGRRGWLGMTWPVEHGGGGRPPMERFVIYEALIGRGAPIATSWFADRQIGPTLIQFGNDDQRARFLPEIIAGRSSWCIGMSEPDAGSDVASLRTRATLDGDTWVVNGQKIWTSGADRSDWCYLVVRTDPEAPPHEGLSELIVDLHADGVTVNPIVDAVGNRHFCEVFFEDVRVPAANLVGTRNGSFRQVMRQMEHERGGIDRLTSNRALYDTYRPRADTTDPLVRQAMADIEIGYTIGRLLVLREVLGQAPKGFSAATKTFCTEFEQRVAGFAVAVAGADAMVWGRAARNVCYAPGYTIMGGTTQILHPRRATAGIAARTTFRAARMSRTPVRAEHQMWSESGQVATRGHR
jgi:alkylation response protein AidB-like acyl-CoA dehydrogenase